MSYSNGLLPSSPSTSTPQRGLPGVGFKLTDNGNYDIENKKLTNVAQGTNGSDVVTKNQLDTGLNTKIDISEASTNT